MSTFFWEVFAKAWHFTLPTYGLSRLLSGFKVHTISFGFWLRVSSEGTDSRITSAPMRDASVPYSPLSLQDYEIRLFSLHPGSNDDCVSGSWECCLKLGSEGRSFEALSYAWGSLDETASILIENSFVSVTKSLEAALRHLRFPDRPRTLWIDYICINQRDIEERNRQVARMDWVYGQASSVLIWLGEATPDTDVGMKILSYFANAPRPELRPVWQNYSSSIVQAGLLDIMSRPWFKRVWVVQEVGLSRSATLVCGRHELKWQSTDTAALRHFERMIKFAEISPQWTHMGLDTVNMQPILDILDLQVGRQLDRPWGGTHRIAPDLLDIAHSLRHRFCTDPRDKVFGSFGFVDDMWDFEQLRPDYNMTVGQVYQALQEVAFR